MLPQSFETILLDSVESTNSYAKEILRGGTTSFLMVIAKRQTKGRGRGENNWVSPPGGVYLTVAAPLDGVNVVSCGPRAALAVMDVLRDVCALTVSIKWPNDLLVNGRKLAGILLELVRSQSGEPHLVLGVGCNVNTTPTLEAGMWYRPTSLFFETGTHYPDVTGLARLLGHAIIKTVYAPVATLCSDEDVLAALCQQSGTLGHEVTVLRPGGECLTGIAHHINNRFALMLEHDGILSEVDAGDCFHTRQTLE